MPGPLLLLLSSPQDADGPWLVCYGIDERVELTGHVLSTWLAKIAGFVTPESTPGDGAHPGFPPHWWSVAWACGTWLAGCNVLLGGSVHIRAAGPLPELSVAFVPESLCDEVEAQALVPLASLALRYPGELPALVLDGAADLMHYLDRFTSVSTAADLVYPRDLAAEGAVPAAPGTPAGAVPSRERPTALTRAQLAARVEVAGASVEADDRFASRAVLVRSPDTVQMLQEILAAWRAGRTVVVLTPEVDDDVATAAIRQEGITA